MQYSIDRRVKNGKQVSLQEVLFLYWYSPRERELLVFICYWNVWKSKDGRRNFWTESGWI